MIIDLDDKANQLKMIVKEKKEASDTFDKINDESLVKYFTDKDKEFFAIYKDTSELEIKDEILISKIDLAKNKKISEEWGFMHNRRMDTYNSIIVKK
jgi:hypothetical protein